MAVKPRLLRAERTGPRPPTPTRVRVRGPVAALFVDRHALAPEDAIRYSPRTRLDRWWFDRLRRQGSLRSGAGGWWLDLAVYNAAAERRSRRALALALPLSLAAAAGALLFYVAD